MREGVVGPDRGTAEYQESPPPTQLKLQAAAGVFWSGAGSVLTQAISFLGSIVLAHLLSPGDYGLVGMARIPIGAIALFRELGTSSAIIQRKIVTQRLLNSIFWGNVAFGVITFLAAQAAAPAAASFFHAPPIVPIIRVLAVGFLFSSIASVPTALLTRDMAFRRLIVLEVIAAAASTAAAIGAATLGAGAWSLVVSSLVSAFLVVALVWRLLPWRPAREARWGDLRSVANFSLNLSAFNVVNYVSRNADNAIVGHYLGTSELGFYQMAYNLMLYAVQNISQIILRVLSLA